jgi:hypothetical protein
VDDGGGRTFSESYAIYRPGGLSGAAPAVFVNGNSAQGGSHWVYEAVHQRFVIIAMNKPSVNFWYTPTSSPDDRTGCGPSGSAVCDSTDIFLKVRADVCPGGAHASQANLDCSKIYDWGMSNAGQFAMELACNSKTAPLIHGFSSGAVQWRGESQSVPFEPCPGFNTHDFSFDVVTGTGDAGMTGCTLPFTLTSCQPGSLKSNPCNTGCANPNLWYVGPYTGNTTLGSKFGCGLPTVTSAGSTGKWTDRVSLCTSNTAIRLSVLNGGTGHAEAYLIGSAGNATTPNPGTSTQDFRDTIHDTWLFWINHYNPN